MPPSRPVRSRPAEEALGLAIDTTFDDTSIALIRGRRTILADLRLSQYAAHAEFGGVAPERASRKHLEVIHPLLARALAQAGRTLHGAEASPLLPEALDYIAVSHTPGLSGAILVGLSVAKALACVLDRPLIGINHIEAHPYATFLTDTPPVFPAVHLVAAGGHTVLLHQRAHHCWRILGRSLDDAAGECVDKVARLWGYSMPGGAAIDRLACAHAPGPYAFPRPMLRKPGFDFSFSGLKTALLYFRQKHPHEAEGPVLSAFFASVCEVLVRRTLRAARHTQVRTVTLSGGLAASRKLREHFHRACRSAGLELHCPPAALCTDNAAMVACLAAHRYAANRYAADHHAAHRYAADHHAAHDHVTPHNVSSHELSSHELSSHELSSHELSSHEAARQQDALMLEAIPNLSME